MNLSALLTSVRHRDGGTPARPTSSQPAKSFDRFLNGFVLLDDGEHGVFFEVHFLGKREYVLRFRPRYDYEPVSVGGDDVTRSYLNAVARDRNIRSGKAIVTDRG